jgi:hypothetical protein
MTIKWGVDDKVDDPATFHVVPSKTSNNLIPIHVAKKNDVGMLNGF